jgi:drug/metabolite transporter (DMT)-like permease
MSLPAAGQRFALLAIVLANVLGGASYPAQKIALAGLPPATVSCLRNAVAVVALLVGRRLFGGPRAAWSRAELLRAVLIGSLAFALPMALGIFGVERAGASNASILILLEPITIVGIAWLFLGERLGRWKVVALVLGFAGALAIVLEGASPHALFASDLMLGNLMLALHGILWGCYTPLAKPLAERHEPFDLCLRTTLVGTLALVPFAWLECADWQAGPTLAPALAWTVALGFCVSFGGTILWLVALRHIEATRVAGFVFLQPLTGVLIGVGWLGERLTLAATAGAALIALAVALDLFVSRRPRP